MLAVSVLLLAVAVPVNLTGSNCAPLEVQFGTCTITPSTDDTAVILDGSAGAPGGATGSGAGDDAGAAGGAGATDPGSAACTPSPIEPDRCYSGRSGRPDAATATPAVVITDVARFQPAFPSPSSEPEGWGVVGLPVNLLGPTGPRIVAGSILGQPAEVRFTPVAWQWDHGDGTAATTAVGGAPWSALGVPEFSSTPTSHVYAARGIISVRLVVVLSAEYRVGDGPWMPVAGVLPVALPEVPLRIASASTVLVDRDCRAAPAGPGC